MKLKNNDTIVLDGKTSQIESIWASGAHTRFKLRDGREVLDLDKLVIAGKARVMQSGQTLAPSGVPHVAIKNKIPPWTP